MQRKGRCKKLAEEVTKFVHGEKELKKLLNHRKLFSSQHAPAEDLTVDELEGMDGIIKLI
jgi:tyrosyl-tRNA synthetase